MVISKVASSLNWVIVVVPPSMAKITPHKVS